MSTFLLSFDAATLSLGGTAPTLEVLIGGTVVSSISMSSGVTSYDVLVDYNGAVPSSVSLRFAGSSGSALDTVTIVSASINNSVLNLVTDLTATILVQAQTAAINAASSLYLQATPTLDATTISGTAQDDGSITGSNGADVVDGLAGNDWVLGRGGNDQINGGAGADYLFGEDGDDTILGGSGNDVLFGNDGDDIIFGEAGNDFIIGGAGSDLLNGGIGNDGITGDAGDDIIFGGEGDDWLLGDAGDDTIFGDNGNDQLLGGIGNDSISGGAGNDTLIGGAGNDLLAGGDGDDQIIGEDGNDTASGGAGDDTIFGGDGNDILAGGDDNDYVSGGAGDDTLSGDDGDDVVIGGAGADIIDGDDGADILHGHGLDADAISTILFNNPNVVYSQETGSFYQFINANVDYDAASAAATATTLSGVSGHLVAITSGAENTFITSIISDDSWHAATDDAVNTQWAWEAGAEAGLQFSDGATAVNNLYENWSGGQPQDNAEHNALISTNGSWHDWPDTSTHSYVIEWEGGLFSDDDAADTINGGAGNDQIYGWGGADILNGGSGNDVLLGGAGDDTLDGGDGDDILKAADGNGYETITTTVTPTSAEVLAANPGLTYNATTGNFYEYVAGGYTWAAADAAASAVSVNGVAGHLITINDASEQTLVNTLSPNNVYLWAGGADSGTEGQWNWLYGAEAGTTFWNTGGSTGEYANWYNGDDVNNSGANDHLLILTQNTYANQWYSYTGTYNNGAYIIEWEGADVLASTTTTTTAYTGGGSASEVNILNGGAGDDVLYGSKGDDTLNGGDDDDILYGGAGDDILSGDAGNDVIYAAGPPEVALNPLSVTFDADAEGFVYADGAPWGGSDGANIVIDGNYIAGDGNTSNGSIEVAFGNTGNSSNSSGSFSITVNLTTAIANAQLSFAYKMELAVGADANENIYTYADVDGTQYGTGGNAYVDIIEGNISEGTYAWKTVTLDVGSLGVGNHTITLGALYNQATAGDEDGYVRFDDVSLTGSTGGSSASESNTLYGGDGDDTLYGSSGDDVIYGDDTTAVTATSTQGWSYQYYNLATSPDNLSQAGFSLNDQRDNNLTSTTSGVSSNLNPAAYDTGDNYALKFETTLTITTAGTYTFRTGSDDGSMLFLDGVLIVNNDGLHGTSYINSAGQALAAGTYTLEATFFEKSGGNTMFVEMSGADTGGGFVGLGNYAGANVVTYSGSGSDGDDIINAEAGMDTLYGGGGMDTFIFEAASAFSETDIIMDYSVSDGDRLDISDILTGAFSGNIKDYLQFTSDGGDTLVQIDANGTAGGTNFQTMAVLDGITGMDELALYNAGNIVI